MPDTKEMNEFLKYYIGAKCTIKNIPNTNNNWVGSEITDITPYILIIQSDFTIAPHLRPITSLTDAEKLHVIQLLR